MSNFRTVLEISRWEFMRWFKLKGMIITFLLFVAFGFIISGTRYFLEKKNTSEVNLVLINPEILPQLNFSNSRIVMTPISPQQTESDLREQVGTGEIDGLLILRSIDDADLVVPKSPRWESELQDILNAERRRLKLEAMDVTADQLTDAMKPMNIQIAFHELSRGPSSLAEKIAAGVLIMLMLMGIFNSLACQMVAITGEKQLRVTEQIISAVTPQQWIDGKILGVSAYAAAGTAITVFSALPFFLVMSLTGSGLPIPIEFSNPLNIIVLIVITLGGFLFWNTFLAAFAATINDPNTSSRAAVLFLPLLPSIAAALIAFQSPESLLTRVLGQLPITSPAVLPVRIVLTEVPFWETALSILILVASTWLMRKLAGRIFRIGMLMYGKEPTVKEMLRWMKEA
ncbi:MAG: ABC transporter permease [bacterium]|nr:ABC transporter permease [bacterium]